MLLSLCWRNWHWVEYLFFSFLFRSHWQFLVEMMRQVSYCSTKTTSLFGHFVSPDLSSGIGSWTQTLGFKCWCKSTTTVLQKLALRRVLIVYFFSLSVIGSGWAQTHGLELMRLVSYCSTKAASLFGIFSLLMSVAELVAGLKPLAYGWWCKSTTTVPQKLALRRVTYFVSFLSHCHWQFLVLNPLPWDDEASVLLLY